MRFPVVLSLLLTAPLLAADPRQSISVSAAISLKDALTEIVQTYDSPGNIRVQLNFGASGTLAAQIAQGAPADVFISAGSAEMDQLAAQNLIDPATRRDICSNELALVVPADAAFIPRSFADLADPRIARIAIGQPKIVPAGRYAAQVFDRMKISQAVAAKLVFGENVRQVLYFVERGEVDAAVVYATDVAAAAGKVRVAATADPSLHDPIVYPAVVLTHNSDPAAARDFLDYLSSPESRKALAAAGFIVPSAATTTRPSPTTAAAP